MTDKKYLMTLHNKKVFEFYQNNNALDFEQINLLCVDLFDNILHNNNTSINKALSSQILNECKENRELINNLNNQLLTINNSIGKLNNDLIIRSLDVKKDYIEEVKNIININTNDKNDKIKSHMEKLNEQLFDKTTIIMNDFKSSSIDKITSSLENSTNHLLDKTKLILNDLIPDNQMKANKPIHDEINKFYTSINDDIKKLTNLNYENDKSINSIFSKYQEKLNSSEKTSQEIIEKQNSILSEINGLLDKNKDEQINKFINSFEVKFNCLIQSLQSPIVSVINASEERINQSICNLNDSTNKQQIIQTKVLSDLEEFLNKYRNSSFKGQLAENHLSSVLTRMFPTAEILDTSKTTSSCDFCLKRENKESILFENKDYVANVDPKEIKKFINDCEVRNSHGIFLSQNTGITSKNNYQIDIHNGKILVYVHNCEYMSHKIQIAIDIIDTLAIKIKELNISESEKENNHYSFTKEIIDEINDEYHKLIDKKETINNVIKEFQKTITIHLEEIKLPKLEFVFPSKYSNSNNKLLRCDTCNVFSSDNNKSMSAHKRWCKKPVLDEVIEEVFDNVVLHLDTSSNNICEEIVFIEEIKNEKQKGKNSKKNKSNKNASS